MRIGQKLIWGFFAVAIWIGVVGYISLTASEKALQKAIGEASASLAAEIMDKIDRAIYSRMEELKARFIGSQLLETTKKSNEEFERLDDIQSYIIQKDKEWTRAPKETVTAFMQKLIDNKLSKDLREGRDFYEKKYGYNVFHEVFVTNKYGANIAQTGRTSNYYQADEEWWKLAKANALYVGDGRYDESSEAYSINVGIRIEDEEGNFIGVMKVVLNAEEAINIIKELEVTEAHKENQKIHFKLLAPDGKQIYSTRPFESSKGLFDKKALSARNGYFVSKENESVEGEKLFAHASSNGYKDYKGLGWTLIVEHETSKILAPVSELKNTILIISLAVTTIAVLTGLLISHSILKPIRKVRDATLKIGKGYLDTKVEIKSNDEVGQLAGSFEKMAAALKRMIDKLNREIAERKKAEQALEALNKELESTIQELIRSNTELKHFDHIVAHDLKSPLRAIGTLADWISMDYGDKLDEQGRKQVDLLKGRARRMSELIDSILQYCEIGRVIRAREEVNLNSLITEAIIEIAPPENISITIENELPVIMCEKTWIIQVFQNLLSNAIKYMDKPQGQIRIACVEENGFWKFSVADNGPGIEEKYFEKIFQMFQTLSPRDEFESTGVGLTLVKKIVELYGGKIWVESEVGKDCVFLFTFPITRNVVKNDRLLLTSSR